MSYSDPITRQQHALALFAPCNLSAMASRPELQTTFVAHLADILVGALGLSRGHAIAAEPGALLASAGISVDGLVAAVDAALARGTTQYPHNGIGLALDDAEKAAQQAQAVAALVEQRKREEDERANDLSVNQMRAVCVRIARSATNNLTGILRTLVVRGVQAQDDKHFYLLLGASPLMSPKMKALRIQADVDIMPGSFIPPCKRKHVSTVRLTQDRTGQEAQSFLIAIRGTSLESNAEGTEDLSSPETRDRLEQLDALIDASGHTLEDAMSLILAAAKSFRIVPEVLAYHLAQRAAEEWEGKFEQARAAHDAAENARSGQYAKGEISRSRGFEAQSFVAPLMPSYMSEDGILAALAEAPTLYADDELYVRDEKRITMHRTLMGADPWFALLADLVKGADWVKTSDIERVTQATDTESRRRAARIMRSLGYARASVRRDGERFYVYARKGTKVEDTSERMSDEDQPLDPRDRGMAQWK